VICLFWKDEIHFLSGEIQGEIIDENRGSAGFGYDPVFVSEGYGLTFAEMDLTEKNRISHRARAVQKLINFVENN
jgi:XTP/dITP diphosphohydrolase